MLGFRFGPRLADMGDRRFWRIDMSADYGTLNGIASHRIDTDVITRNWDDMLRVVGSLRLGVVEPLELMRILQGDFAGEKCRDLQAGNCTPDATARASLSYP